MSYMSKSTGWLQIQLEEHSALLPFFNGSGMTQGVLPFETKNMVFPLFHVQKLIVLAPESYFKIDDGRRLYLKAAG